MSEAPERIWARVSPDWHCGETGEYFVGGMFDAGHFKDGQKYIRADLVEAAVKRALEGAAAEISPHPDHDKADWTEYAHHAHRLAQLIRAIDPAQFIEEPK
jgi:hypothetical protein